MRISLILIILLNLVGCSQNISQKDLHYLNGYWEISEVKFPDGSSKKYKINPTIDYIELKGTKGIRKKVKPRFDGTYVPSEDLENFTIIEKGGHYEMYYKKNMSDWTEKLTQLSEGSFSVTNAENITYHYQRFHNINVKDNGETKI